MSVRILHAGVAALCLAGIAAAPHARAATYNFASSIGSANDFSLTAGGVTATFSSTSGPGTFAVASTAGLFSFPVGLGDFSSFSGDPLTITFSSPVSSRIQISFAIEDAFGTFGPDTLTATTNTGQVVTAGTTLDALSFSEPEGTLSFLPTQAIKSLTLTSANPFAIASLDVPEPMSLSLLGVGLAAVALTRKRRAG